MLNSNFDVDYDLVLSSDEVDTLIQEVQSQLNQHCFDSTNYLVMQRMVAGFADSRGMARLSLTEAFGKIGEPATPLLMQSISHHPNPVVRRSSAKALAIIADAQAIPVLIQSLIHDEDTVVRGSSAGALAKMGKTAVPALLDILADPEQSVIAKGQVTWALAFIGAEAKELLYEVLDSESAEVRVAAIGAIAKVAEDGQQDNETFNVLINALADSSELVRGNAAAILGNLAYQPAVPNLIALLDHDHWDTRKSAALALMKIGDRVAIQPLQVALEQESEGSVQPILKLALSQLEHKDS